MDYFVYLFYSETRTQSKSVKLNTRLRKCVCVCVHLSRGVEIGVGGLRAPVCSAATDAVTMATLCSRSKILGRLFGSTPNALACTHCRRMCWHTHCGLSVSVNKSSSTSVSDQFAVSQQALLVYFTSSFSSP